MSKIYIEDFCEDLNYQGCILYIDDDIDLDSLYDRLQSDMVNHLYRYEIIRQTRMFYVENCDLQEVNDEQDLIELIADENGTVFRLKEDSNGYYLHIPSFIENQMSNTSRAGLNMDEKIKRMRTLSRFSSADPESTHAEMDSILCDILEELGYKEIVNLFKSSKRYYC